MANRNAMVASLLVGAGMMGSIPLLGSSAALAQAVPADATKADEPVVKTKDVAPIPVEPEEIDIITVEPSEEHVWIPGFYERESGNWKWVKGRWEKPPHKHAIWHFGHWRYEGGENWRWHRGHWAVEPGMGYFIEEAIEVPAPIHEMPGVPPTKTAHWVAGHWEWQGDWRWRKGHWDKRPQKYEHLSWVPGQWHRTLMGDHRWVAGHYVERRGRP